MTGYVQFYHTMNPHQIEKDRFNSLKKDIKILKKLYSIEK